MAGALPEAELLQATRDAGLVGGRIVARYRAFEATSSGSQVAQHLRLQGVTFFARKPR